MLHHILYDWLGLNLWLFHAINDAPGLYNSRIMRLAAAVALNRTFPLWFAAACVVATGDIHLSRSPGRVRTRKHLWLLAIATMAGAAVFDAPLIDLLKDYFQYLRPFALLPPGQIHIAPDMQASVKPATSFPSGHSAFAMLLAASVWPALNRPGKAAASLFVLWIGLSRIALGVHFPVDVVSGFLVSLSCVILTRMAVRHLQSGYSHPASTQDAVE